MDSDNPGARCCKAGVARLQYHIIVSELAASTRPVPEVIIDVNREPTGVSHVFFNYGSPDYDNFKTVCRSGLWHLDLAVDISDTPPPGPTGWLCSLSGLLEDVSSKGTLFISTIQ